MAKETPEGQSDRQLRRAWFGGVRRDDVTRVVAALTDRNVELGVELAETETANAELLSRLSSAEGTLEAFDASIRQMGTILTLAEEHAKTIRGTAEGDAERIRVEARQQGNAIRAEIGELLERKQAVIDSILALRANLEVVAQAAYPSAEIDPRSALPPLLPPNVEPH